MLGEKGKKMNFASSPNKYDWTWDFESRKCHKLNFANIRGFC